MKSALPPIRTALPYLWLAIALILCGGAFIRSEQYRAESDLNFSQSYEIQWRTTQIREHLTRMNGDLRLAAATGVLNVDLGRQLFLLNTNVSQLLRLEYVSKFLRERDVELLRGLQANLKAHISPIVDGSADFEGALRYMPDLEQRMFEVSGTAVAHGATLNEASHIAAAASRNRFLFAVALAFAAVGYTIIHLRNAFARRRDHQLRSFSSLYAHMTRSRVTALRLFLDYQDDESAKHPEMLAAAKEAVQQLETITNGLANIAYAQKDGTTERLSDIVASIVSTHPAKITLDIEPEAALTVVPATQMRLILDELVENAVAALSDRSDARIEIKAQINRQPFRKVQRLLLEIADNGPGMSREVLEKATTPFFSTKAGSHTGLGLAGCVQMVTTLRGKFTMASEIGHGTSVQIRMPVSAWQARSQT